MQNRTYKCANFHVGKEVKQECAHTHTFDFAKSTKNMYKAGVNIDGTQISQRVPFTWF